jgi:hypothetical protein
MQEQSNPISPFDSAAFKAVMYFKFFMVIAVWGLIPLLIPVGWLSFLGLQAISPHILFLRLWGIIVLGDFFLYLYIYRHPRTRLAGYCMLIAVADNAGVGIIVLAVTLLHGLPWGIWANIPFQLFFGWWFLRFFRANRAGL